MTDRLTEIEARLEDADDYHCQQCRIYLYPVTMATTADLRYLLERVRELEARCEMVVSRLTQHENTVWDAAIEEGWNDELHTNTLWAFRHGLSFRSAVEIVRAALTEGESE